MTAPTLTPIIEIDSDLVKKRIVVDEFHFMRPILGYDMAVRRLGQVYGLTEKTIQKYLWEAGISPDWKRRQYA